jgi:glutaminyl-peptide cyclotransferase
MSRLRAYGIELVLVAILLGAVGFFAYLGSGLMQSNAEAQEFSGERALASAERQLGFGTRITGTDSSMRMSEWLTKELVRLNWHVLIEPFSVSDDVSAHNIIAVREHQTANAPVAIIGAHYDTRLVADRDANTANHTRSTLGANSGASGPAVLLELARTLDTNASGHTICLVFLDAEDNGGLPGWEPNLGSRYFVENLNLNGVNECAAARVAVIVDLVGNRDQQIYIEQTGDAALSQALWQVAGNLEYGDHLRNQARHAQPGTHMIFLEAGIRASVLADYDYPYRYTVGDTLDKLEADSFEAVGRTLETWLESGARVADTP